MALYYYKTSSMNIYGDIWLKLICQHVLWGLWWSPGPKLDEKYAKYANFDSLNPDIQSWASILCWNTFNDFLWSYMIESDMLKCAVTCFCIYGDLQYKKNYSKMCQIYRFFPLLIPNVQLGPLILCRDIFNDYL